jgi:hypothetical protein
MKLLTTAQVAEMHGVTPSRVRAIAAARGVQPAIDEPRYKMWTQQQARALAPGKTGRPAKSG